MMKREDFDDVINVISTIREKHNGGKYDAFIELLHNEHIELFKTFLMQEMHKAEIDAKTFGELKATAKPFLASATAYDAQWYIVDFRIDVRNRVGLPPDGEFQTVEEFFDHRNER